MTRAGKEWEKIPETAQMTWQTYEAIQSVLEYADKLVANAGKAIGESADPGEWHENFAFEQAHRDHDQAIALKDWLHNLLSTRISFIPPRQETDIVGLGNRVTIQDEIGEPKTITLLSTFDARFGPKQYMSISNETPIGKAIMGKYIGETVTIHVTEHRQRFEHHWKILNILPGNFQAPPENLNLT